MSNIREKQIAEQVDMDSRYLSLNPAGAHSPKILVHIYVRPTYKKR